ncbi:MAG: AMP-binding protein, partial [Ruminococcus sp.]|nr:AMP-binding protein [Ruminococcus sp.]
RAAYLPIDLSLPAARMREVVDDANPQWIIVSCDGSWGDKQRTECFGKARSEGVVCITELSRSEDGAQRRESDVHLASHSDLAYLIYTSGSTGKPKGVMVEQGAVANLLYSFQSTPGLGSGEAILASTTLSFDISVLEIFLPLVLGGRVELTPCSMSENPERVRQFVM